MTFEEEESALADLRAGNLTARKTIARLVAGGKKQSAAEARVFIELGGGDIAHGDRYYPSGKLISEVRLRMEE